jgi:hypothetical protein
MAENLLDTCNVCKEFNVGGCCDGIVFGLAVANANDTIFYTLTDKFGKEYLGTFTTDAAGFGGLDFNDFPDGFFNPYAGTMIISFFTTAYRTTAIAGDCACMTINLVESTDTATAYLIC